MIRAAFLDTLARYGMDDLMIRAGVVVAGFSGGADSSCLLRLLHEHCRTLGVTLAAAHINHRIRGDSANRDEEFCRNVCRELDIPLYVGVYDVPALAKEWSMGLEETARKVRYAYFDQVSAILTGAPSKAVIATAHNATDNTETVLFHLLRGTGLHGLCGIAPLRDERYIRPLIRISGDDIRCWCRDNKIPSVTDETNADTSYTRNRIRHDILPHLREITPSPEDSITRLTSLLRQDDDFLEQTAQNLAGTGTSLPRDSLTGLHPAVLSRILRILYSRLSPGSSPGEIHIRSCIELLLSDRTDASLDLPGSIRFLIDRHTVRFEQAAKTAPKKADFEFSFDHSNYENSLYNISFQMGISPENQQNFTSLFNKDENIYKLSIHKTLDFDKIIGALKIRNRREGDTFYYGGMTRRVKKLLTDHKLTAEEKACLPILCDDCGIVWIPGFPLRDGMEYTEGGTPLTVTVLEKY